jgi:hypothetical protein
VWKPIASVWEVGVACVKSWRRIAPYIVIVAGIAGLLRFSVWAIIFAALLLSLVRSKMLDERTNEVIQEWRAEGKQAGVVKAHALVLLASLCSHLLFCGLAFSVGAGISWLVW